MRDIGWLEASGEDVTSQFHALVPAAELDPLKTFEVLTVPVDQPLLHLQPDITQLLRRQLLGLRPRIHDLIGRTAAELLGTSVIDLVHPDDLEVALGALANNLSRVSEGSPVELRPRNLPAPPIVLVASEVRPWQHLVTGSVR